jgi:filamentous hemagglutinin
MCPLAAGSTPAAPSDPYADLVSDLRDAGHKIDPVDSRKEWEKAGRGLQKHHDRPENRNLPADEKKWQCPDGKQNPASWNPLGRKTQDEILNNIDTIEHAYSRKYKTDILEVRATDGRGIRYKVAGGKFEFMGFCD